MPDGQYPPTIKPGKIGVDSNKSDILGEKFEKYPHDFDDLLEYDRLMGKCILLNEKDLTKKIGVIRGDRISLGVWNTFAAMYTIGSNDGSCGITFETQEKGTSEGVACAVERMRIDAAGNVGIGTAKPQSQLHLNVPGSVSPISAMTVDVQTFGNMANAQASNFFQVRDIGAKPPKGQTHFIINGLGNVGIGTASPSAKLNIDPKGTGGIVIGNPSTGSGGFTSLIIGISAESDGYASLQSIRKSGSQWGDISLNPNAGNIGIGTTSPKAKLDVQGDIRAGNSDIYFTKVDHNHTGIGNTAGYAAIENAKNYDALMILGRAGTSKGRYVRLWDYLQINGSMDVTGNVGIGTTSPSAKLEVNGDIKVTGDVILTNADCAEDFDITCTESVEPGTVMVINDGGTLKPSQRAYDKRVAGVISGAGDYRPGITLDKQANKTNRLPLALTGKVFCKVDAEHSPIEVGDLLTTSSTIGHAMKVIDHVSSLGAIIGKALRPLEAGCGLIPILVALQ